MLEIQEEPIVSSKIVDETIYIPRHRLDVGEMADLALRKSWRKVLIYAILLSGLVGFIIYNIVAPAFGLSVQMVVTVSIFFALIVAAASIRGTRETVTKQAQSLAFEDRTIYFNHRSITVEYAGGMSTTVPWTCFLKAEWGPNLLLMYITGFQYVTIPRRVLDERIENQIKRELDTAKQQKGLLAPPPLT